MAYLVFSDQTKAEAARDARDVELGYPESLDSLRYVGGGRHCPKEFGRALHYCEITEHKDGGQWAILDKGTPPDGEIASKMDELPSDWHSDILLSE